MLHIFNLLLEKVQKSGFQKENEIRLRLCPEFQPPCVVYFDCWRIVGNKTTERLEGKEQNGHEMIMNQ